MGRKLVISDIHGCAKTFQYLVENEISLIKEDKLYLLGDYIDRGKDSKGVIDYIFHLKESGYEVYALKGNHEQMLLNSWNELPFYEKNWRHNGGEATLKSFGIIHTKEVPEKYIKFFSSLVHYIELDKFILVHAGLNFDMENPFEDEESMIWIRNYRILPGKIKNKIIVQGHTPTSLTAIKESIKECHTTHRIFLDNGCVYDRPEFGLGHLCCLDLDTLQLHHCSRQD